VFFFWGRGFYYNKYFPLSSVWFGVFALYYRFVFPVSTWGGLGLFKDIFFQGLGLGFSDRDFSYYMDWFHNFNYSLLLGVLCFVVFLFLFLFFSVVFFKSTRAEYQWGELLCSLFPSGILLVQIIPSLSLLYFYGLMGRDSQFSVKVVGHQ